MAGGTTFELPPTCLCGHRLLMHSIGGPCLKMSTPLCGCRVFRQDPEAGGMA